MSTALSQNGDYPEIPAHVLSAFQTDGTNPVMLGAPWDNGAKFDRIVLAPASPTSAWSAKVREHFTSSAVRVARPVRATDGRVVVGGFKANDYLEGEPATRVDEAIAAALAFEEAMAGVEVPTVDRDDIWANADRAVWKDQPALEPVGVAHLDFLACCLFSGTLPPALTDIVPSIEPRPLGYTAALVIVDALILDAVDQRVLSRWAHVPGIDGLTERALAYREATFASQTGLSNISSNISRVRDLLMSR